MTKILIVAATPAEAGFLSASLKKARTGTITSLLPSLNHHIDVLITGPGITATTYHLARALNKSSYDLALNVGICGSLDPEIGPVKVVNITTDQFGDFGAEDGSKNLDIYEMGLAKKNDPPFKNGKLHASFKNKLSSLGALPVANGITVQRAHGSRSGCRKSFEKFGPVMESMEGAAFFYVCLMENVKCLQIRAISNKVERRNRNKWKLPEALDALAGFTGLLLMELESNPNS